MPVRHFVHVIGFEVPTRSSADEPLVVLLDKEPTTTWRAVFQLCVEELAPGLLHGDPVIDGRQIRLHPTQPATRRLAADIRQFVDRVNRMTFLKQGLPAGLPLPK